MAKIIKLAAKKASKKKVAAAVPAAKPIPTFAFASYASRFNQAPKKGGSNG